MTQEHRMIAALKQVKQELLIPAAEYVPAIPACWEIIDAALAASTPVGGWEGAEREEVLRLLRTINRECDIGRHEADVLSIIDRLAAPPPPSVSIDKGDHIGDVTQMIDDGCSSNEGAGQ